MGLGPIAPNRCDLAKLEKEARVAKVGLWSLPNPVPPWEFRKDVFLIHTFTVR